MCGSCANECAYKIAMITYAQRKRGSMTAPATQEEMDSCMCNALPGSANYGILSFKMGFHGRLFGSLSSSTSKALHKLDMPAFDWPHAISPHYKYPLADNEEYNRAQDDASLMDARTKIAQWKSERGVEVVAAIIEPIQAEGGDNYISGYFGQGLRDLTKELGIFMIVDEVQTGVCATGSFWCHEQWNLDTPPDFVTFAKKMLSCGFYHTDETKMETPNRHFNTYFGDPLRSWLTLAQNEIIKEDNLISNVQHSG